MLYLPERTARHFNEFINEEAQAPNMYFEIIPPDVYESLTDQDSYLNRAKGLEKLKSVVSDANVTPVSSESMLEFLGFLGTMLDDTNFKVFHGALQVLNLVIKKLEDRVEFYFQPIVTTAIKGLGEARSVARHELMRAFGQLMRVLAPQRVLEPVVGQLKHRSSRVREDALNIITAALLTHPRKDLDVAGLCYEVAPCLADSKRRVRLAALELFAVLDYSLEAGRKQPLLRAVDRVELCGEAHGLMAAVQARRARRALPRLSAEGLVEYALTLPKPGQRRSPQLGSGHAADLDWVLGGEQQERPRGEGSPFLRAPPWERASLPGAPRVEVSIKDSHSPNVELTSEPFVTSFGTTEPYQPRISGRRETKKNGASDSNHHLQDSSNLSYSERVLPRSGRSPSGHPAVERTLSLPSHSPQNNLLLPSYPLTGQLTSSPSWRRGDSSLSMSSTWPSKRDSSPSCGDSSPQRDSAGDSVSDGHSSLPSRVSLIRSSSASFSPLRPLSGSRPVPPILRADELCRSPTSSLQDCLDGRNFLLDMVDQDEEIVDREEMMNSLRSLRFSAAKKRAKMSLSGSDPDPDSPDSAVKLDSALDSPSQASPSAASQLSESGLSSLYSPPSSMLNGTYSSAGYSATKTTSSICQTSTRMINGAESLDTYYGLLHCEMEAADVTVVGQRVTYSNGQSDADEEVRRKASPPPSRIRGREQLRVNRTSRGQKVNDSQSLSASSMPEGVVGRGVFGSLTRLSSPPAALMSVEQEAPLTEPPGGVYGQAVTVNQHTTTGGPETEEEFAEKGKLTRSAREKMQRSQEHQVEKMCQQIHHMVTECGTEEFAGYKDWQLMGNTLMAPKSPREDLISLSSTLQPSTSTKCLSPAEAPDSPLLTHQTILHTAPRQQTPPFTTRQPTPPSLPRQSKTNKTRLRRAPSLTRTQPSVSHSPDDLSPRAASQKTDLRPFSNPELALTQSFKLLNFDDWEKKIEGLNIMRSLAQYHSDILQAKLHDVCLALIQEVKNLRSGVARIAVVALGDLYTRLQRGMDQQLEGTAKVLLQKAGESNSFMRQDVDLALDCLVQNCSPTRAVAALLNGGLNHLNPVVRRCAAQHLATLIEKMGASRVLSGSRDVTDRVLPAIARLSQDPSQEARFFGRRMLLLVASHQDFDGMVEKYIPVKDLPAIRDTVFTLKTKGLGEMPQDSHSAKRSSSLPRSGTVRRSSSLNRVPVSINRDLGEYRGQAQNIADRMDYVKQLSALFGSKDFRERIRGVEQVVADCESNPDMVLANIFPVFDALKSRLQESNTKVNLHALQSLEKIITALKNNLAPTIYILVPAIVDNHLNSKSTAIYEAAVGAIRKLMQHIDNALLLQPFCTKAQYLCGKAKVDLIERVAEMVTNLYPRKPQMVEQKVLPLLWHLLDTSSNGGSVVGRGGSIRGATCTLCHILHHLMGPSLAEFASNQSHNIYKSFNEMLKCLSTV